MGDRHDYVALEWVKGEIAETLKQARQALESYVEKPEDPTQMGFCLAYVHQVRGTLQMVEFYGAALLAEETEHLAQALIDNQVLNRNEALEVLMQAILQLPNYLDRIQVARRDLPMVVLPLLNDLRAARGEQLLSETSLFSPDLSQRPAALSVEALGHLGTAELPTLLRKLRQMLQLSLVGVIRNQDLSRNLNHIARVFARLEMLCKDAPLSPLWGISLAVVEGLSNGSISLGSSIRNLLRQVDRELKRLVDQGVEGMNQPAPDELIKNLLFYVAKASDQSPRARTIKDAYNLDEALPGAALVDEERARLAGPDREAMRSVISALCEELVRVKDNLDLFVRSDRTNLGELETLLAPLKQTADTLAVLGFGQPRRVVLDQIETVSALAHGQREVNDANLMDVAGALLYVEATLAGMAGPGNDAVSEELHLPTTDVGQIHQVVIKEARNGLELAKDAIIEFIASQWNHTHLARVPDLLTQVRGGLAMIAQVRASKLLEACNLYIQEQLLARQAVPDWQSLDTLADAITGVEYYLERLSEDPSARNDPILDVAEESLHSLGYATQPGSPFAAQPLAPLDDPLGEIDVLAGADLPIVSEPVEVSEADWDFSQEFLATETTAQESSTENPSAQTQSPETQQPEHLSYELEPLQPIQSTEPENPASEQDWLSGLDLSEAHLANESRPDVELPSLEEGAIDLPSVEAEQPELDITDLDLPEIELPTAPLHNELPGETASLLQAVAAPKVNPPAKDIPLSLLPPPADEEPIDEELREVFIEEAEEVLENIRNQLPVWRSDVEDREAQTEIRRGFHTLKGSGRMVRALVVGELAWAIENMLNRVLDQSIDASPEVLQLIDDILPLFSELVAEYAANAQRQRDDVDHMAAVAYALARGEPLPMPNKAAAEAQVEELTDSNLEDEGFDPQLLDIFRNEAEAHLDTLGRFLADCAEQLPQPVTDDLQRALHTLKGSARMAGILPIAEIATPLERLMKEFKTNLLQIDLREVELLQDAERLFNIGLHQLLSGQPLAEIAGSDLLLKKIAQVRLDRLGKNSEIECVEKAEAPRAIGAFLTEGVDALLDADQLLQSWREHRGEELQSLCAELESLIKGAQQAELPQMAELASALLAVHEALQEGRLAVSEQLFGTLSIAHEALVGMADQIAAALHVDERPEQVQALYKLLENPEPEEAPEVAGVEDIWPLLDTTPEANVEASEQAEISSKLDTLENLGSPAAHSEPTGIETSEQAETSSNLDTSETHSELSEAIEEDAWPLFDKTLQPSIETVEQAPSGLPRLDEEMVAIFLEEAIDILENAGQALDQWLAEPENLAALSKLQRNLHTLKGGARMAEISPIGDLAHELESLYEGLLEGRFHYSVPLGELLHNCHDQVSGMLDELQGARPLTNPAELIQQIHAFKQNPEAFDAPKVQALDESVEPALASAEQPEEALQSMPEAPLAEPTLADSASENDQGEADFSLDLEVGDQELVGIFLEEAFDILENSSTALQRWMDKTDNSMELELLQRDLHTLKGGARMAEIAPVGDLAHELEFLYESLSSGALRVSEQLFRLLQSSHDCLQDMLEAVRDQRSIPENGALEAIRQFRADPEQQQNMPSSVSLQAVTAEVEDANAETAEAEAVEAEILDIFLDEAEELLEGMQSALSRWDNTEDTGALQEMMRILHTLKGGARLAGQIELGDLAHNLEQQLTDAQQQKMPWPENLQGQVHAAFDELQARVDQLRQHLDEVTEDGLQLVHLTLPEQELEAPSLPGILMAVSEAPQTATEVVLPFVQRAEEAAQEEAARRAPQELVKVPAPLLEGLVNLAGETSIFRGRVEQQVSDIGSTLAEMEATIERVRDQLRRLDTETQAQIISRHQAELERPGYEEFDPLEMDRYSQLQQLSRALFESASDLFDLKQTLAAKNRDAETLLLQQARVNTELQEGLMRTRMVPFDRLLPRLRRIVRQISGELGKRAELVVTNTEGEMDRTVLERIVAPLEHMLRNAVDHGIESAEARRLTGKPEVGSIHLSMLREGGDILLNLADDGAGVSVEKVRKKAIERGLISADNDFTDHEILQLILESGLTTAEKITQISGRGVGMTVAVSEVKQMGGSITVYSTPGQGTRFSIRLPFTVSVNRALMALSGEDLYALPLNTIEGIVRVSPYELETLYNQSAEGLVPRFEYAGQNYELKYLGDLLNNGQQPKLVGQSLPLPVILVRSQDIAVAVQVDALLGSREIVVKSLGTQFSGVSGISGATLLGDGRVVVILDLLASIRIRQAQALQARPRSRLISPEVPEAERQKPILVMVVDDSVTVRKVTSRLLERNGMNVLTAKDGVDAIAQLQEHKPDLMLLDIEMPRMDGFEVATLVRHDEKLKGLPIIMITSRTGEKHRDRALAIGVNQYLGKPYQESELLDSIVRLVKGNV